MKDLKNVKTGELIAENKSVELVDGLQLQLSQSRTGRIVNVKLANV